VTHRYRVTITRKAGLSDPEGATTRKALVDLGFGDVEHVSFGRVITLDLAVDDDASGRAQVDAMCAKLLANPVMEEYTVEAIS
jgi:phosphoribosylformylglycinamidine synthase PurS subunit